MRARARIVEYIMIPLHSFRVLIWFFLKVLLRSPQRGQEVRTMITDLFTKSVIFWLKVTFPLSTCTWFLKYRVMNLVFSYFELDFAGYIGSKNHVQNRQEIKLYKLDISQIKWKYCISRYKAVGIIILHCLQMQVLLENNTFLLHKIVRILGIIRVAGIIRGRALYEKIQYQ